MTSQLAQKVISNIGQNARMSSQSNIETQEVTPESVKEPFIASEEAPILERCSEIEITPTFALITSIVSGFTIGCLIGYTGIMLFL